MNAGSLVTLWVDPALSQDRQMHVREHRPRISAASWLFRDRQVRRPDEHGEAFPGVWLPRRVEVTAAITLALGRLDVAYSLDYLNYRRADVTATIRGAQPK